MSDITGFTRVSAGVVFFLLVPSVIAQAETADASVVQAQDVNTEAAPVATTEQRAPSRYVFPRWPESRQMNRREQIPPPPPGPYMSTALSDFSIKGPSFGNGMYDPTASSGSTQVKAETFSPDVPWPDNLRDAPNHWKPSTGYRFVSPDTRSRRSGYPDASGRRYSPPAYGYRPKMPVRRDGGVYPSPPPARHGRPPVSYQARPAQPPVPGLNRGSNYRNKPVRETGRAYYR